MVCLSRSYHSRFFKGYLPQIFLVHSWILCTIYLLEKQLLFWKSMATFHNKYYFLKSSLEVYIRFWQMLEQILVKFCLCLLPFQNWYLPVFQFVGKSWFCFDISFCFNINFCRYSLNLLKSCDHHPHCPLNEIILA